MASTGVAIGSLYTLTIGWINGREYTNSQRPIISPSTRAEAKRRKSILSEWCPAVFHENWMINGMQITPAEKTALIYDPTRAMNDINNIIIALGAEDSVFAFDFSIDPLFER